MNSERSSLSADDVLRKSVAPFMVVPQFDSAFNMPPPLQEARVAIVTTAGLMRHGEESWGHDDTDFRVFDSAERDLVAGHVSISLDRVGMVMDRNVYYPVDRLNELADRGVIGSVAPRHISFMGALRGANELSTVIMDSGPRAAKLLRDDGVDVVLITPICPACARTVLVLGHVLESQGLSTVVLASNLEIAKNARTPRALYCDFPLGWPVGPPKDPEFQHRVLATALGMLEAAEGPILEVFPDVIKSDAETPMACTLPPRFDPDVPPPVDEARGLKPAWERARAQNGATNVGRLLGPEEVPDAIASFQKIAEGAHWRDAFETEKKMVESAADIKHYYEEAATALIDYVPSARAGEAWFYRTTKTGALLKEVCKQLQDSGQEKELSLMALQYLVPLSQSGDLNSKKMASLRLFEWRPLQKVFAAVFAWSLKRKMKQKKQEAG